MHFSKFHIYLAKNGRKVIIYYNRLVICYNKTRQNKAKQNKTKQKRSNPPKDKKGNNQRHRQQQKSKTKQIAKH